MRFFQFEAVEHNHQNTRFLASKARMFQQLPNFCLTDMFRCHCFSYSKLSICLLEVWYYNKCSVVSRDPGSRSSCLSKKQFLKNSLAFPQESVPAQTVDQHKHYWTSRWLKSGSSTVGHLPKSKSKSK